MTPTPQARCDLLIIGAGPAGMAAALAAAPSGMRITVVDDNPAPGGQIWRDGPGVQLPPLHASTAKAWHTTPTSKCSMAPAWSAWATGPTQAMRPP